MQQLSSKQKLVQCKIDADKSAIDWTRLYGNFKDTLWINYTSKAQESFYQGSQFGVTPMISSIFHQPIMR